MRLLDLNRLKALAAAGVEVPQCIHEAGDLLYIPQGLICVVSSVSAKPSDLIFGFRKSFFAQTEQAIEQYGVCIGLSQASARDTVRMKALLDTMKTGSVKSDRVVLCWRG